MSRQRKREDAAGGGDLLVVTVAPPPKRARKAADAPPAAAGQVRNTLESLTRPMQPADFLARHYRRRAVAFVGGGAGRVRWLRERYLSGLDIAAQVHSTASERPHVWMRTKQGRQTSFTVDDAQTAVDCWHCGASLYFRAPESMERDFLPSIAQDLGMNFAAFDQGGAVRGEIETFAAQPGSVTDWHYDFMENFTIQISGQRRWRLRASGQPHPHRSCAAHFEPPGSALLHTQVCLARLHDPNWEPRTPPSTGGEDVVLAAGDVLYHPAGIWHRVETVGDEEAVSVNLSFMPATWGSVLEDVVRGLVLIQPELRERVCLSGANPLAEAREGLRRRLDLLADALRGLDARGAMPETRVLPARAVRSPPPLPRMLHLDGTGVIISSSPPAAAGWLNAKLALPRTAGAQTAHDNVVRSPLGLISISSPQELRGGVEWPLAGGLRRAAAAARAAALNAENWAERGEAASSERAEEEEEEEAGAGAEEEHFECLVQHSFGAGEDGHPAVQVALRVPPFCRTLVLGLMALPPNAPRPFAALVKGCGALTTKELRAARGVVQLLDWIGYLRTA